MNFIQVLFMIIENMFRNLNLKMKFFLIIIFIISVNKSNAETCKWWFQRYGWKNFSLNEVEDCLKIGSPVIADVKGGDSPLHIAAEVSNDPEILLRLIRAGAEINGTNDKGWTPLHSAARFNSNPEILLTLIDAGAKMNSKTTSGKTFIFWMEKNSELKKTIGYLELLKMYDLAQ